MTVAVEVDLDRLAEVYYLSGLSRVKSPSPLPIPPSLERSHRSPSPHCAGCTGEEGAGGRKLSAIWEKGVEGWILVVREGMTQGCESRQNLVGDEEGGGVKDDCKVRRH